MSDVTRLLDAAAAGDRTAAAELLPLVYDELRGSPPPGWRPSGRATRSSHRPGPRGVPAARRPADAVGGTTAATSSPPRPRPCAASWSTTPAARRRRKRGGGRRPGRPRRRARAATRDDRPARPGRGPHPAGGRGPGRGRVVELRQFAGLGHEEVGRRPGRHGLRGPAEVGVRPRLAPRRPGRLNRPTFFDSPAGRTCAWMGRRHAGGPPVPRRPEPRPSRVPAAPASRRPGRPGRRPRPALRPDTGRPPAGRGAARAPTTEPDSLLDRAGPAPCRRHRPASAGRTPRRPRPPPRPAEARRDRHRRPVQAAARRSARAAWAPSGWPSRREPVKRLGRREAHQAGDGLAGGAGPVRGRAAGPGPDGPPATSPRCSTAARPTTGRPFFVMELVKGVPLTEYCDARRLTRPRPAGAVRAGLLGRAARPPEGGHPPRPQAVQRPGRPSTTASRSRR